MNISRVWEPYDALVWPHDPHEAFVAHVEQWGDVIVETSHMGHYVDSEPVRPGDMLVRALSDNAVVYVLSPDDFRQRFKEL